MRTLKKALSLVLVLAMVFTLAVPALAVDKATEFKDYDKVENKEAVDVLTAIGVLNGNTDGTFGPEGNFTRAQAASIIAHMMLGKGADALNAAATGFSDVPADHWASGYIQYCVGEGILNGYGNGKFGPDDALTATQWSLMLLGALGYDAKNEKIGGNGWEVATTKLAIQAGIASAENLTGEFNRDVAAKLAFNTLTATMVDYTNGTNITTGDGTSININANRYEVGNNAEPVGNSYKNGVQTPYTQFCEQYFSSLKVAPVQSDAFGRPANQWSYKLKTLGTYGQTADLVFTSAVSGATTAAKVNNMGLKGYTVAAGLKAVVNGKEGSAITSVNDLPALTGNGLKVEVFLSDTTANQIEAVTVIKTELAKVAAVTSNRITLTSVTANVVGALSVDKENDNFAALSEMKKGDYVLVVPVKNDDGSYSVDSIAVPETVTGKVTATSKQNNNNISLTVDGTAYSVAAIAHNDVKTATPNATTESTLWLDTYGNVLYAELSSTATTNFLYVLNGYQTLTDGKIVNMAKGVLTNGEIVDVRVAAAVTEDCTLYKVTDITNDVYTLNKAEAGTTADTNFIALTNNKQIKSSDRALTADNSGATNFYSSNVVFVYVDTTNKTAVVKEGVQAVNPIVNSATGEEQAQALAVLEKNSKTDATAVVTMVVLESNVSTTATAEGLLYVKDNTSVGSVTVTNKTTGKDEVIPTYEAYQNGEKVTFASKTAPAANTFYTYAESESTGAYVLSTAYTATSGAAAVKTNVALSSMFDGRIATIDGTQIDLSSALIVDLRAAGIQADQPVVTTAEGLNDAKTAYGSINLSVIYDANTGVATNVYVISTDKGYAVTTSGVNGTYDVAPADVSYAAGEVVTLTFTQKTAAALSTGATVTVTGAPEGYTAAVTTAGVAGAPDVTAVKGVITVSFTMPAQAVTISNIEIK